MSESVKIPVSYGINNHTYAEVTPDLARQIEALARDASEEQQFPPEARIAPAKRCVELENAALRARVEAAERRADEMEGKAGEWIAADVHKQRVQAAVGPLSVAVKALTAERDRALADLKRSEKEAGTLCAKVVNLSADLAAERDSLSRMQGAYESLERERSGLSARLIDLQGKYESQVGMGADMEITRLRADLAAERERRERAEAWMDHLRNDAPRHVDALDKWLKTCENMAPLINRAQDAEKERDEARAEVAARESQLQGVANARREDQERIVRLVGEVAALKARKVKLPPAFEISVYRDGKFIKAMEADRVIDAIRAAGVDVES